MLVSVLRTGTLSAMSNVIKYLSDILLTPFSFEKNCDSTV